MNMFTKGLCWIFLLASLPVFSQLNGDDPQTLNDCIRERKGREEICRSVQDQCRDDLSTNDFICASTGQTYNAEAICNFFYSSCKDESQAIFNECRENLRGPTVPRGIPPLTCEQVKDIQLARCQVALDLCEGDCQRSPNNFYSCPDKSCGSICQQAVNTCTANAYDDYAECLGAP